MVLVFMQFLRTVLYLDKDIHKIGQNKSSTRLSCSAFPVRSHFFAYLSITSLCIPGSFNILKFIDLCVEYIRKLGFSLEERILNVLYPLNKDLFSSQS